MRIVYLDPGGVLMTQKAFSDDKISNVLNVLNVVSNKEDAISHLLKEGGFADKDEPDPVLLDLNLPRRNGREVLREVEGDPELRRIPIVVLTTSDAEEDVLASYDCTPTRSSVSPLTSSSSSPRSVPSTTSSSAS